MADVTGQLTVSVLRPDDLLNLEISCVNLQLASEEGGTHPRLVVADRAQRALLIVRFPPQTIFEEAYFDDDPGQPAGQKPVSEDGSTVPKRDEGTSDHPRPGDPGTAHARLGGESRLVFKVPADVEIPYTVAGLLDWSLLELVVTPIADVPKGERPVTPLTIREPSDDESTLNMPFRLHLSPTRNVTWRHASDVVEHAGRTELWHTRLLNNDEAGRAVEPTADDPAHLRAVWSPDYLPAGDIPKHPETGLDPGPDPLPPGTPIIRGPMDKSDRHQIVVLTSAFSGYAKDSFTLYTPEPIDATLVMLSPLGGWLRSIGVWDPPSRIVSRFGPVFERPVFKRRLPDLPPREEPLPDQPKRLPPVVDRRLPDVPLPDVPVRDAPLQDVRRSDAQIRELSVFDRLQRMPGDLLRRNTGDLLRPKVDIRVRPDLPWLSRYELGQQLDVSQWAHIAAQGRDHYVRIVYDGRLKKFGHKASLVKVTERRFEETPDGRPVAYLRQYMYIVVREPERRFPLDGSPATMARDGRRLPLRRVRLTTLVTPHINDPYAPPANIVLPNGDGTDSFWVMVGGEPFDFHGFAEDVNGNRFDFTTACVFVPNSEITGSGAAGVFDAITHSMDVDHPLWARAVVPGQRISFAERVPDGHPSAAQDNVTFATEWLDFGHAGTTAVDFFTPTLRQAKVHVPAVEAVTGSNRAVPIALDSTYVNGGFAAGSKTDVFATLVPGASLPAKFTPAQAGAVATPNLDVTTLTRLAGPLGGKTEDVRSNTFDPSVVFSAAEAVLFGQFPLKDLVLGGADVDGPTMTVHRDNTKIVTALKWEPTTRKLDVGIASFEPLGDKRFKVYATFTKNLASAADPVTEMQGMLGKFDLTFLDSLVVHFQSFSFRSVTGSKPDVSVNLDGQSPVEFKGDLAFVAALKDALPPGVFGDGVGIDLIQNPLGVRAGLEIGLPPATVGVFQLKNIAFSAGLTVPFLAGRPFVEFGFASREKPFLLAVLIFGGGGFFHIALDTEGIKQLEAAFEFGATAGLDIGVASGEVHIMAGIYFKMEKRTVGSLGEVMVSSLSGYLRAGGSLCVLGIVRISVEFCLSFTYYLELDKAKGRATLTVEVSIACFSKSVELTVERAFGGHSNDPTFKESMPTAALWADYADAFA